MSATIAAWPYRDHRGVRRGEAGAPIDQGNNDHECTVVDNLASIYLAPASPLRIRRNSMIVVGHIIDSPRFDHFGR